MTETFNIQLLFFGALGDELQTKSENFAVPEGCRNIGQLREFLANRGANWTKLISKATLCAANHSIVDDNYDIGDADEIAFFPPVTGG